MRLEYRRFAHTSNTQIIQVSKLVDGIKLLDAATSNSNDDQFSSNSEADIGKKSEPDINTYITSILALLNKIIKSIKDFCNMYIKSKYIKIIKHQAMTPIVPKLEEIYINLQGLYDL